MLQVLLRYRTGSLPLVLTPFESESEIIRCLAALLRIWYNHVSFFLLSAHIFAMHYKRFRVKLALRLACNVFTLKPALQSLISLGF